MSGRWAHVLAMLAPPLVIGGLLLLSAEMFLRWQRFGSAGIVRPLEFMAPAWRDADCFKTGPNGELMTPNCRMPYKGVSIETNAAGLNDRAVDEAKPHYRLLVLGDSVTMAAGVENRAIYHAVLEDRLNQNLGSPDFVELYNYGRGGRTPIEELGDFEAALARWDLDAAVVAFTPGNLWANLLRPESCEAGEPDQPLPSDDLAFYKKRVKGASLFSDILVVGERITGLWALHVPRDFVRSIVKRLSSGPNDAERLARLEATAVEKFLSCARRMRRIADAAEVKLAWIVLWYRPDRHAEIVRHELTKMGEDVTTMMSVHQAYTSTEDMIIYAREVHPNAAVHRNFADELYPWLAEMGWTDEIEAAYRTRALPQGG